MPPLVAVSTPAAAAFPPHDVTGNIVVIVGDLAATPAAVSCGAYVQPYGSPVTFG
jgi:hypothetical protein